MMKSRFWFPELNPPRPLHLQVEYASEFRYRTASAPPHAHTRFPTSILLKSLLACVTHPHPCYPPTSTRR